MDIEHTYEMDIEHTYEMDIEHTYEMDTEHFTNQNLSVVAAKFCFGWFVM